MSYTETITCRVAIQVCIGYLPNGRERHRTFSMKGIHPDATDEAIAAVVRALAPVLAYPIIKVRKVVKRTIIFDEWKAPAAPAAALTLTAQARPELVPAASVPVEPEPVLPACFPLAEEASPWVCEAGEEEKFALAALFALLLLRAWAALYYRGPYPLRGQYPSGAGPPQRPAGKPPPRVACPRLTGVFPADGGLFSEA